MFSWKSVFMPGAHPRDPISSKTSIGAMHYPAWLARELHKGREFEVVKVFIQTEHHCLLDGTAVEFRANLTYDVPKELAEIFIAEREGALPIAVLMEPGTEPRRAKDESKVIVKVKMLSTQKSSPDGISVLDYKGGETYDLPKPIADGFLREGWAELKTSKDDKEEK